MVTSPDVHCIRPPGWHFRQRHDPFPIPSSGTMISITIKLNFYFFIGRSPSPKGERSVSLQHHAIRYYAWKYYLAVSDNKRKQYKKKYCKPHEHSFHMYAWS